MPKLLSVLLGCYGDYPQYSLRAVQSIISNSTKRSQFEILVGCNECSNSVLSPLRHLLDAGQIDFLVESRPNLNKDPMLRALLALSRTPYIVWMDDDSHVLCGWDEHLIEFIELEQPFDVAGHVFFMGDRSTEHLEFLRSRPWYHSSDREASPIWFATGGLFLANVAFLRRHGFPDAGMIKRSDDILLGELCQQQEGRLVDFAGNRNIMNRIKVSDGERRGLGEGDDGWNTSSIAK